MKKLFPGHKITSFAQLCTMQESSLCISFTPSIHGQHQEVTGSPFPVFVSIQLANKPIRMMSMKVSSSGWLVYDFEEVRTGQHNQVGTAAAEVDDRILACSSGFIDIYTTDLEHVGPPDLGSPGYFSEVRDISKLATCIILALLNLMS